MHATMCLNAVRLNKKQILQLNQCHIIYAKHYVITSHSWVWVSIQCCMCLYDKHKITKITVFWYVMLCSLAPKFQQF